MRKLKNQELNRMNVDEFKSSKKTPLIIVLDNIRSMHNVGSAFRTADSFRLEKIVLTGITAQPPHREINKTALGATESVAWEYYDKSLSAINHLKEEGYQIVSVEQVENSTPVNEFNPSSAKKYALVFGNEVYGVDQEVVRNSDLALEIPQFGTKHSLNVSVSIGIIVWDFFQKTNLRR